MLAFPVAVAAADFVVLVHTSIVAVADVIAFVVSTVVAMLKSVALAIHTLKLLLSYCCCYLCLSPSIVHARALAIRIVAIVASFGVLFPHLSSLFLQLICCNSLALYIMQLLLMLCR